MSDEVGRAPVGADEQPVSKLQWVDRDRLHANDWNPNIVAPPELKLLKLSILEDGWTQPIVVRAHDETPDDFEIVDGFHRWTVSAEAKIAHLTDSHVPVVVTHPPHGQERMSTIRHNRARGTHHVVKMADIVATLVTDFGLDPDQVRVRLGMDTEEMNRLLMRGNMLERGAGEGFNEAWRPVAKE